MIKEEKYGYKDKSHQLKEKRGKFNMGSLIFKQPKTFRKRQ